MQVQPISFSLSTIDGKTSVVMAGLWILSVDAFIGEGESLRSIVLLKFEKVFYQGCDCLII